MLHALPSTVKSKRKMPFFSQGKKKTNPISSFALIFAHFHNVSNFHLKEEEKRES